MESEPRWRHVDYEPGADEFWDRLGGSEDWGAIDGVAPGIRVYATWAEHPSGRMVVSAVSLKGSADSAVTADTLRAVPIGRLEAAANEVRRGSALHALEQVAPLSRRSPDMSPEDFYRLVATHYRWHAAISNHPAAHMAKGSGVPVSTVHRWVREARARGYLPKGHQGKAG